MNKSTSNQFPLIPIGEYYISDLMCSESPLRFGFSNLNCGRIIKFDILKESPIRSIEFDKSKFSFFKGEEKVFFNQAINNLAYDHQPENVTGLDCSFQTEFPNDLDPIYISDTECEPEQSIKIELPEKPKSIVQIESKILPKKEKSSMNSSITLKYLEIEESNLPASTSFKKEEMSTASNSPHSNNPINLKGAILSELVNLKRLNKRNRKQNQAKPVAVSSKISTKPKEKKQTKLSRNSKKITKKIHMPHAVKSENVSTSYIHEEKLTRKIVKNFGKAIASFACSGNAKPLIMPLIENDPKRYSQFLQFVYENKDTIEGNRRLKLLLKVYPDDTPQLIQNKTIFKYVAEKFMDGHVYRWLWNSHVENKSLHANLIGQVRLRIQEPDLLDHLTN